MQRLRTNWLALMGAIFLLTLTVSSAFGAPPSGTAGNRGQSISGFVHELVFGADEADDEANEDQDEVDEEENADEETLEGGTDEEEEGSADENLEEGTEAVSEEREVPAEFANHGECVSDAAHDTDDLEGSEAANKGEWVSLHAQYLCWGLTPPDAEEEDATGEETEGDVDEDADAEELAAREQAKADRVAARAERQAAREAARAERESAKAASQQQTVETTGRSNGNGGSGGNGNGRGGGRP